MAPRGTYRYAAPVPTWQRVYIAACAGVIGYALAYVLSVFADWPKLTYLPYQRAWGVYDRPPGPLPTNYLGIVLWGLAGALGAAILAWGITRFVRREASRRWLLLFGGWALTAFFLAGLFFTWALLT